MQPHPLVQPGAPGLLGEVGQQPDLGTDAQYRPGLVVPVDPGAARDQVGADMAAADLLVLHPQRTASCPFPVRCPLLYLVEALTDLGGPGAPRGKTTRLPLAPRANPGH